MNSFRTHSLVIVSALTVSVAGLAVTAPVMASVPQVRVVSDVPQMNVQYTDLDLQSPEGQRTLAHRVNIAADAVCSPVDDGSHFAFNQCRANAKRSAKVQLADRNVTSGAM